MENLPPCTIVRSLMHIITLAPDKISPNYRVVSDIPAESWLSMFVLLGAVKSLVLQPYDSIDKSSSSHFMRLCW